MIIDKAKYYFSELEKQNLPVQNSYISGGMLLGWCIESNIVNKWFSTEFESEINKFLNRQVSGPELYQNIDGVLSTELLNQIGIEFLPKYFEQHFKEDFISTFNAYSQIFQVEDNWSNYLQLKSVLDERFRHWSTDLKEISDFDIKREFDLYLIDFETNYLKGKGYKIDQSMKNDLELSFVKTDSQNSYVFAIGQQSIDKHILIDIHGAVITNSEIEKIVNPLLIKHQLVGKIYKGSTIRLNSSTTYLIDKKEEYDTFIKRNKTSKLQTKIDITEWFNKFEIYIESFIIPFMEKYSEPSSIFEEISKLDLSQMHYLLGTGAMFKKFLFQKKISHENFLSDINEKIERIQKKKVDNPEEALYESYLSILQEIRDI